MTKAHKKAAWRSLFTVEKKTIEVIEEIESFLFRRKRIRVVEKFAVIHVGTDVVLGLYDNSKYACSRARYFYKRFCNKSEKILLG